MNNQKRILIIDDDVDICEAMKIILESENYLIDVAYNGDDGLKKMKESKPDLIILDVMMRSTDEGFQVAYEIQNNPDFSKIPIIMVSAVSKETGFKFSPETDGDWLPVSEFIEKPVKPQTLLEKVKKSLG